MEIQNLGGPELYKYYILTYADNLDVLFRRTGSVIYIYNFLQYQSIKSELPIQMLGKYFVGNYSFSDI